MKEIMPGVRLGYACQNMSMPSVTAAHRVTVKRLLGLARGEQLNQLRATVRNNLISLRQILEFNVEKKIELYRIPSEFVPLATHEITKGWNYFEEFSKEFQTLGEYIRIHGLRITLHVTQYTFLNSPKASVSQQAIEDIHYHTGILDAMGLDDSAVVVMHLGGVYGNKEQAKQRFLDQFQKINQQAKRRLVIENDDKSYSIRDVLTITEQINVPAILDYHHLCCHNDGEGLAEILPAVQRSWGERRMKFHFSSPRSESEFRSHSDYIDSTDFVQFLHQVHRLGVTDFDVMLECKAKDLALLRLREECKKQIKK